MAHRRSFGTKLVVDCPGCGKPRVLIHVASYGLGETGGPWAIRHHAKDRHGCWGSGKRYRRGDPGVKEVPR